MRNKKQIDARDQALARHVERITCAQGVSALVEVKRQVRRVLAAIQHVDGSIDTLARELARLRRARQSSHSDSND